MAPAYLALLEYNSKINVNDLSSLLVNKLVAQMTVTCVENSRVSRVYNRSRTAPNSKTYRYQECVPPYCSLQQSEYIAAWIRTRSPVNDRRSRQRSTGKRGNGASGYYQMLLVYCLVANPFFACPFFVVCRQSGDPFGDTFCTGQAAARQDSISNAPRVCDDCPRGNL